MAVERIVRPDGTIEERTLTTAQLDVLRNTKPPSLKSQLRPLFPNASDTPYGTFTVALRRKYLNHKWEIEQHARSEDVEALRTVLDEMEADPDYSDFTTLLQQAKGLIQ